MEQTNLNSPCRPLVIFINGDFTRLENGSHIRMRDLIAWAARHFPAVTVYSYRQHPSHPWTGAGVRRFAALFPAVPLVLDNAAWTTRLVTRLKNFLLATAVMKAERVARLCWPGATPHWSRIREAETPPVLLVNFVDGLTLVNGVSLADSMVETHDIKFSKFAQQNALSREHWRVRAKRRSEVSLLGRTMGIVAISVADLAVFRRLLPEVPAFLVPTYRETAAAVATANVERDIDLLFVGADNYFNLTGLTACLTQNRAWLQGRRIAVAGLICDNPALQTLARDWPDIALLGFVEDLSTVYARSRVALAPVEGTGLKIKVVEALEHGTPVLGSQHALAALPSGYEECVLPLSRENVERLLDEPGALHRAELAAARYMAEFRSAGDRDRLLAWLAAAMGRPPAPHSCGQPRAS